MATARIASRLRKLLRILDLPEAELSVLFVGDHAMRSLNRKYRGKDRTTDVLSFSLREGMFPSIQPQVLGDIVISIPAARRQANEAGHSLGREIDQLLVHGLLHLMGYDHDRGRGSAEAMKKKESQLLKKLYA